MTAFAAADMALEEDADKSVNLLVVPANVDDPLLSV